LQCLQLLPVARVLWGRHASGDIAGFDLRCALASAILMSAIDNLLNGSMILPLLLVIGGLTPSLPISADTTARGQRSPRGVREFKDRTPARVQQSGRRMSKSV
jgi:hypothetical protein